MTLGRSIHYGCLISVRKDKSLHYRGKWRSVVTTNRINFTTTWPFIIPFDFLISSVSWPWLQHHYCNEIGHPTSHWMCGLFTVAGPNTDESKYPRLPSSRAKCLFIAGRRNEHRLDYWAVWKLLMHIRLQMSAVVLTSSPCALRFNITTANQTHESRRFVVVHNQIWTTNGLFCLPEGGSYDRDVTIHLNIPEPTINTKKPFTPFNFATVFTLRNVYTVSNTGLTTFTAITLKRPDWLKPPSLWAVKVNGLKHE